MKAETLQTPTKKAKKLTTSTTEVNDPPIMVET
jgi:hypothetical protein